MRKTTAEKIYELGSYRVLGSATQYVADMHLYLPSAKFNNHKLFQAKQALESPAFFQVLESRHSCHKFCSEELSLNKIRSLLLCGYGLKSRHGSFTVPLAGGLDVMQLKVALRERGRWGAYDWDHVGYRLNKINRMLSDPNKLFFARSTDISLSSAAIVISANLGVLAKRYTARAYKFACIQAGHIAQNIILEATSLGLSSLVLGSLKEEEIINSFGIISEKPLYAVVIGKNLKE